MANEINKLNIGGTDYPIYSEGVKLDNGGSFFLTTFGTSGNQKIGISDAILGNKNDGIQINSTSTSIIGEKGLADNTIGNLDRLDVFSGHVTSNASDSNGNSSTIRQAGAGILIKSNINGDGTSFLTINSNYDPIEKSSTGISMHSIDNINMNAEGNFYITSDYTTDIYSPTIHIGGNESDWIVDKILIGSDSTVIKIDPGLISDWRDYWADKEIIIGATTVSVGDCANTVSVGDSADNVTVGDSAANVNVGVRATNVNLGSGRSNIAIGTGIKLTAGNTTLITPTNEEIQIGYRSNATEPIPSTIRLGVRITYNASSNVNNTYSTLYMGANTIPVDNGTAYKGVSIGSSSYKIKDGYFYNLYYAGSCTKSSDERLKIFGDNLKVDFDALANIRKANYTWKDTEQYGSQNNIGVSAQELREVYPEFVVEDSETGLLSVDYSGLSVVALAAIDELHKENVELKSRLDKLEALLTKITEQ